MKRLCLLIIGMGLGGIGLSATTLHAQSERPATQIEVPPGSPSVSRDLQGELFHASDPLGWSIEVVIPSLPPNPAPATFLLLSDAQKRSWLEGKFAGEEGSRSVEFSLDTDFSDKPLLVTMPLRPIPLAQKSVFLLRYSGFRLDLYCDGVLVDQEWPMGQVLTGATPTIEVAAPAAHVSIWGTPLTDASIVAANGGESQVARRTNAFFGPEPANMQYSRPRGFNTNAGDAMPFYHDGAFHLFYLLDRRQHHSKWGLGAHQWAHVSSTDLVHWTEYPIALPIDHEWEGSICTGSIYYHDGIYHAYYATRMPDRSEHLATAVSRDGIHFQKILPTPFAEPAPPFIHGPNRDPSVFGDGSQFHMLVTAAVTGSNGSASEGALEHLTSPDLSQWSVGQKPILLSGSGDQPECSDLFKWGNWYYLLYSLRGTTHYKMAASPLGPWVSPATEILDGPEAIVMKSAAFKGNRRILVGFLQRDGHYGGDRIFRELLQQKDGILGTTLPKEMQPAGSSPTHLPDTRLDAVKPKASLSRSNGYVRLVANVDAESHSSYVIAVGSADLHNEEQLIFDPRTHQVSWWKADGKPAAAKLQSVSDLDKPVSIALTLYGTVADLSINGHRTLIHRLDAMKDPQITFTNKGSAVRLSNVSVSKLKQP
jgi:beta-fructofuranosidase